MYLLFDLKQIFDLKSYYNLKKWKLYYERFCRENEYAYLDFYG